VMRSFMSALNGVNLEVNINYKITIVSRFL